MANEGRRGGADGGGDTDWGVMVGDKDGDGLPELAGPTHGDSADMRSRRMESGGALEGGGSSSKLPSSEECYNDAKCTSGGNRRNNAKCMSRGNRSNIEFKPMIENKLLDNEGTPLPPSYDNNLLKINTGALMFDFENLDLRSQERITDQIITTHLRKWRSREMGRNRLLHHKKRNGVGIVQGWCECIDEGIHPCKIVLDLLDISKEEIRDWEETGIWSWDIVGTNKSVDKEESKCIKNTKYENREIYLCIEIGNLTLQCNGGGGGGGGGIEGDANLQLQLEEARPELWTRILPPPPNK